MKTQWEVHETVYLKSIESVKPVNNYVLCRRLENHFEDKSKGFFKAIKTFNRDQYRTQNVERLFEVTMLPKDLDCSRYWGTRVDIKKGDRVIVSFRDSLDSKVIITDDGEEYRFILYFKIITAIRGDKIIPVNGYILFTPLYYSTPTSILAPQQSQKVIDPRFGKVEYSSYPNYDYKGLDLDKGVIINKGDKVVFLNSFTKFAPVLEDKLFRTLDKEYYYCHRYHVGGKII